MAIHTLCLAPSMHDVSEKVLFLFAKSVGSTAWGIWSTRGDRRMVFVIFSILCGLLGLKSCH